MSWSSLRKPNVTLRIARYAPETEAEVPEQEEQPESGSLGTVEYPDWRVEELARKYASEESPDEFRDYADSVGMRRWEKL